MELESEPKNVKELLNQACREAGKLSEEEAQATLDAEAEFSTLTRRIFGEQILNEIKNLIDLEEIRELDLMVMTGDISVGEFFNYCASLPIFRISMEEMREIAKKMAVQLRKKIPYYLTKTFKKDGALKSSDNIGFFQLLDLCSDFQYEMMINTTFSLRNFLLCIGASSLTLEFIYDFFEKSTKHFQSDFANIKGYNSIFKALSEMKNEIEISHDPYAKHSYDLWITLFSLLGHTFHPDQVTRLDFFDELEEFACSPEAFSKQFKEMQELIEFRSLKNKYFSINGKKICIESQSNDNYSLHRWHFLASCKITWEDNFYILCQLNTENGELYLSLSSLPLQNFLSKEQYLGIKGLLYQEILGQLRAKEADIHVPVAPLNQPSIDESQEQTRTDISKSVKFVYQAPADCQESIGTKTTNPPQKRNSSSSSRLKAIKTISTNTFTNIPGKKVLKAITKILGQELRQRGSHHIFRAKNGKDSYPLPIHGHGTVGGGLLKNFIDNCGIDYEEFFEALE